MTCFTKRFVFLGLCAILFFGLIAILMLPMAARCCDHRRRGNGHAERHQYAGTR